MKHSVPKGDKKRKKQVTLEAAQLEADLEDKHKKELEEFKDNKRSPESDVSLLNPLDLSGLNI